MKRIFALILVLCIALSLCACGQTEAAKAAQEAISQIGQVSYSSNSAISAAEELFNNLTKEEQDSVTNAADLFAAREAYNKLVIEPIEKLSQQIWDINSALNQMDLFSGHTMIESVRQELNSMDPELYDMAVKITLDEFSQELPDQLDTFEEYITLFWVNNTYFAQPIYVVSPEAYSHNIVNDHGEFAAYNWFSLDRDEAEKAFEEYKEYVSKHTEINETGTFSFTFLDNSGNKVSVALSSDMLSSGYYLSQIQVRVPRF